MLLLDQLYHLSGVTHAYTIHMPVPEENMTSKLNPKLSENYVIITSPILQVQVIEGLLGMSLSLTKCIGSHHDVLTIWVGTSYCRETEYNIRGCQASRVSSVSFDSSAKKPKKNFWLAQASPSCPVCWINCSSLKLPFIDFLWQIVFVLQKHCWCKVQSVGTALFYSFFILCHCHTVFALYPEVIACP